MYVLTKNEIYIIIHCLSALVSFFRVLIHILCSSVCLCKFISCTYTVMFVCLGKSWYVQDDLILGVEKFCLR
jgi:hypothetical protein